MNLSGAALRTAMQKKLSQYRVGKSKEARPSLNYFAQHYQA
jgi:hypothetical protein